MIGLSPMLDVGSAVVVIEKCRIYGPSQSPLIYLPARLHHGRWCILSLRCSCAFLVLICTFLVFPYTLIILFHVYLYVYPNTCMSRLYVALLRSTPSCVSLCLRVFMRIVAWVRLGVFRIYSHSIIIIG